MEKQTTTSIKQHGKNITPHSQKIGITVPTEDVEWIKSMAKVLRAGGKQAKQVRKTLTSVVPTKQAHTGADLVNFLRNSPLVHEHLTIKRDRSTGRTANFE